jgi:Tfp pilus assembly protein PilV
MQRKNYILKSNPHKGRAVFLKKRSGFAMIMAIIVVLVVSTIMALSLALTAQTSKRTVDLYLYEQVALHAKSAAELALLDIAQNGCTDNYNTTFNGSIYTANVTMRYVYETSIGGCTDYFNITTPEQSGSVLMDVTVSVNDPSITTEPIRYFRRSIQKL